MRIAILLVAVGLVACEHEAGLNDSCDRTWIDRPDCESGLVCDESTETCRPVRPE